MSTERQTITEMGDIQEVRLGARTRIAPHQGDPFSVQCLLESDESWHNVAQFQGTVAWFNNAKGFGFLSRTDGPDVFVHYSAIESDGYKKLEEGDAVEFDVIQGHNDKLQAHNVTRISNIAKKVAQPFSSV